MAFAYNMRHARISIILKNADIALGNEPHWNVVTRNVCWQNAGGVQGSSGIILKRNPLALGSSQLFSSHQNLPVDGILDSENHIEGSPTTKLTNMKPGPVLKVAITQAEPEWLDVTGTVAKTISLIAEAANGGAKLVAFPECWISGYPGWIW